MASVCTEVNLSPYSPLQEPLWKAFRLSDSYMGRERQSTVLTKFSANIQSLWYQHDTTCQALCRTSLQTQPGLFEHGTSGTLLHSAPSRPIWYPNTRQTPFIEFFSNFLVLWLSLQHILSPLATVQKRMVHSTPKKQQMSGMMDKEEQVLYARQPQNFSLLKGKFGESQSAPKYSMVNTIH